MRVPQRQWETQSQMVSGNVVLLRIVAKKNMEEEFGNDVHEACGLVGDLALKYTLLDRGLAGLFAEARIKHISGDV